MGLAFDLINGAPYVCTAPGTGAAAAGICAEELPDGEGLREDGRGFVHIMQSGFYTFHGATVNRAPEGTPLFLRANTGASVQATSSRVEWTRPDGVRQAIPRRLLYPPFE